MTGAAWPNTTLFERSSSSRRHWGPADRGSLLGQMKEMPFHRRELAETFRQIQRTPTTAEALRSSFP